MSRVMELPVCVHISIASLSILSATLRNTVLSDKLYDLLAYFHTTVYTLDSRWSIMRAAGRERISVKYGACTLSSLLADRLAAPWSGLFPQSE